MVIARQALESRLAQLLALPVGRIRIMVDAALAGRDIRIKVDGESETEGSGPEVHPELAEVASAAPGGDFGVMEVSVPAVSDMTEPLPAPGTDPRSLNKAFTPQTNPSATAFHLSFKRVRIRCTSLPRGLRRSSTSSSITAA